MPVTAKPKNWFPAQLLWQRRLLEEMLEDVLEEMQQAVQANVR